MGGPGVLTIYGVAGTGKTETIKDICLMLGKSSTVINASNELPEDTAWWQQVNKQADVVIIDEANRATKSSIEAAVHCARQAHVPLCLTFNPGYKDRCIDVHEVLGDKYKSVPTSLPHIPTILSSMLA